MDRETELYILNILREGTIRWKGRARCLIDARVSIKEGKLKNGKDKLKFYWRCAKCEELFRDISNMEVDHIVQVGSFTGCFDKYTRKMYQEDNLQVLCVSCHQKKTSFHARSLLQKKG